jgi:uncharacterized protein (DUF1697 family)
VVEGGGLENRFPVLRNGGSNPSPSATVALLRGVNNVGRRKITMAALKSAFESMGFENVRTVLASGNVVFDSPGRDPHVERTISRGLEDVLGYPVPVAIRTVRRLRALVGAAPFKGVAAGPGAMLYVTFLSAKRPSGTRPGPSSRAGGFRIVRVDPQEIYSVVRPSRGERTPDLMRYLDRTLGRDGTTRNWRTVLKLAGRRA